jgi:hypothetical protein
MKKRILLAAIIFFALASLARAENIFSSEAIYGPEDFQGSLSWKYSGSWWLSYLDTTTDGELSIGLGFSFPELEIFDYNSFEAIVVDFQAAGGLVFVEDGVAEDYFFVSPFVQMSDCAQILFFQSEQVARFTKEDFGWWSTNNQIFLQTGKNSFGWFCQTHHNGTFSFSFFGPLYKNRVSEKFNIEIFLGINPEKEKMGGAKLSFVIP